MTVTKKVAEIKKEAHGRGITLWVLPSEVDPTLWILSHVDVSKVAIIGTVPSFETKGESQLVAYGIDVPKWHWAQDEGFNKDQICQHGDLRNMIFNPIPLNDILEYLEVPT